MIHLKAYFLVATLLSSGVVARAADEPWSDDFAPPPGDYTWIQLDSGEWLKGEIVALYDEVLRFDSDHFDQIDIDLEDVVSVHGRGIFVVSLNEGRAVYGTLNIRGQQISVTQKDGSLEFERSELVSITQAAARERDRWGGDISAGMNVRRGNSEVYELDISASLRRRTPVSRISLDYIGNNNETDGEKITDSHRINLAVDRFTSRRLYWRPVSVQYYKDELQNISHQGTVDTGLGYHLLDSGRWDWELTAGVGGNYLESVSVAPGEPNGEWSPVGTFGSDLTVDITSWIEWEFLVNMSFLEESAGRYQHHIVSTLSTDLIGGIDLDFSFIWDRTEVPQEAEGGLTPEQDDFRSVVSLTYDF